MCCVMDCQSSNWKPGDPIIMCRDCYLEGEEPTMLSWLLRKYCKLVGHNWYISEYFGEDYCHCRRCGLIALKS